MSVSEKVKAKLKQTPEQKLETAANLYWGARALKAAYFKQKHPEWTEEEIKQKVKEWMQNLKD